MSGIVSVSLKPQILAFFGFYTLERSGLIDTLSWGVGKPIRSNLDFLDI